MQSLLEKTKDFWDDNQVRRYTGSKGVRKTNINRRANICQ
jgi:hypothetical protein